MHVKPTNLQVKFGASEPAFITKIVQMHDIYIKDAKCFASPSKKLGQVIMFNRYELQVGSRTDSLCIITRRLVASELSAFYQALQKSIDILPWPENPWLPYP